MPYPDMVVPDLPSPNAALVRQMLRHAALRRPGTLAQWRVAYERAAEAFAAAPADLEVVPVGAASGIWIRRPAGNRPVLLYLHGGFYCLGSARTHLHLAGLLADAAGAACLVLDYRRGPEDPFPAAVDDGLAALRAIRAAAPDSPLVVAGDSAGAGLALSVAMRVRDDGSRPPDLLVLLSPWTDLTCSSRSHRELAAADPVLATDDLRAMAARYAGGADPRRPELSPLFGDLARLPPVLVQAGGQEVLLDDAMGLVDGIRAAGGRAVLHHWPHMFHVWQWYHPILPEGVRALRDAGEVIRAVTAGAGTPPDRTAGCAASTPAAGTASSAPTGRRG
ncbi:alpha/beta hydrolase [Dactylosporangium salmoneum]|uniref:Alpha/beta hydrolase fold-3 domain-containing protein n=1 Tax=Dactylosporangium salmoneum TaxID=53361 RepID=A0ABP5TYQ7_9ACTN